MSALTKFYSPRPLSEQEMYRIAPSIFNRTAHPDRTVKFKPIATIDTVRALALEGFEPFGVTQNRTFDRDRSPYTKHMLKFRKIGIDNQPMQRVGDSVLEVILTNANDGSKRFTLDAGVFKLACLNGMVVKSEDFGAIAVTHRGDAVQKVIEGAHQIAAYAGSVMRAPAEWSKLPVSPERALKLAEAAHALRFAGDKRITPQQLLIPRRWNDKGRDLWTIFNVVQENTVMGGVSEIHPQGQRSWTTRSVTSIGPNLRLNKQLWELGEAVAKELT